MKKSIIISIKPKWVEKILNGEKTIEIRKSIPKCELPIDVYIYCTKGKPFLMVGRNDNKTYLDNGGEESVYSPNHNYIGNGKIVAKFTLNKVDKISNCGSCFEIVNESYAYTNAIGNRSCLDFNDMKKYLNNGNGYAWHIENLQFFDKPMELSEFCKGNYEQIIDHLQTVGCDSVYCPHLNDEGCDIMYCPILKIKKAPQSWCYCYKEKE